MLCIEGRTGFTGSFDARLLSLICNKKYSIRYCSQIKCLIIISIDTRPIKPAGSYSYSSFCYCLKFETIS